MNYLLFNNEIIASDGVKVKRIQKSLDDKSFFDQLSEVHLCVVDSNVLIASALESAPDKKDGVLAKKFEGIYPGEYVLQDEKLKDNTFQVIGIKSEKVREIYSLIQSDKVLTFVPYAIALRQFLHNKDLQSTTSIVFLDDTGGEKLITVFEGLKFSRTRTVTEDNAQQILPEIKRSIIDFGSKLGEYKDPRAEGYIVVTNNKRIADEFKKLDPNLNVTLFESVCPAVEGLKAGGFNLKYRLPDEIIKKRKLEAIKQRTLSVTISALVLAIGIIFFIYNKINLHLSKVAFRNEDTRNLILKQKINNLDPYIYRNTLQKEKKVDFPLVYLKIENSIPLSYEMKSFSFAGSNGSWTFEEYLITADDQSYENILPVGLLKTAHIKDLLINNHPGKYLKVQL